MCVIGYFWLAAAREPGNCVTSVRGSAFDYLGERKKTSQDLNELQIGMTIEHSDCQ